MSLDFLVNLVDGVSGPAKAVTTAFKAVEDSFRGIETAAEGLAEENPEKVIEGIGQAAEAVIGAVESLTEQLLSAAVAATTLREQTEISLSRLLGGAQAGADEYKKILQLAEELGLRQEDVAAKVKQLIATGMSPTEAAQAIKAVADLDAVTGKGDVLQRILMTMDAKGKFDNRVITQLARAGISTDAVIQQLAKTMHKSTADVAAAMKAGQIDAKTGMEAIMAVVEGKFGGTAGQMAKSVPGLINAIQIEFQKMLDHVDLTPLKKFLGGILDALKGPAGDHLSAALTHLVNAVLGAFGLLGGADGPAGIIDGLARGIEVFAKGVERYLPPTIEALTTIAHAIGVVVDYIEMIAPIAETSFAILGAVAEAVQDPLGAIIDLANKLTEIWGGISLVDAGRNLVMGIVEGIESGASAAINAIVNLAKSLVTAVQNTLQMHSPSELLRKIVRAGVGGGIALGANEAANDVQPAMARAVAPPSAGAVAGSHAAAAAGGARAAGGASRSVSVGELHVHAPGGTADEIAKSVRKEIVAIMEDSAVESGAAAA